MQFIRLPKPIDIAERVLPELVADCVDTYSGKSINIIVLQQLRVSMLVSRVIEWSTSWMAHWGTFGNFTQRAWAIWDLSNHDLFRIIPDPGSQQRVTLSLESICTIPFQARASAVKMPMLRQHSSNSGMPGFVNVRGTLPGTWDQPNNNPYAVCRCAAVIFSNITDCEIQWPGMLITRKIDQVSLLRWTFDWHNRLSSRKLILWIPPPITHVHLIVDSTTLRVSEVHRFKTKVHLKWEMCQKELDTFENIPVV
jgi:hypothetical protein